MSSAELAAVGWLRWWLAVLAVGCWVTLQACWSTWGYVGICGSMLR